MIIKENDEYCVYSEDKKIKFGCYPTRPQAKRRLKQIEYFKQVNRGEVNRG